MTTTQHLQNAIDLAGGQTGLANKINQHLSPSVPPIKQASIWSWLHRSKQVPSEYAIALQLAVDGKVTAAQVCPETFRPDIAELVIKQGVAA